MSKKQHLSASEATATLGISAATLYSYVSRGLIRSEAVDSSRNRRYNAEDVERLRQHKEQRKDPAKAAQNALAWGSPLIESALTLITEDSLYYRGHDALQLATSRSAEEVAALLWTGDFAAAGEIGAAEFDADVLDRLPAGLDPLPRLIVALALAGADDLAAYDLSAARVVRSGARILRLMAAVLGGDPASHAPLAEQLAHGWHLTDPAATALLNAALILCADHELNASAFAARVAAGAQAQPYNVMIAGLSTLQGFKHAGNTLRVAALLDEIGVVENVGPVLAARLRRGERIPGFGHKIYRVDDPRGRKLLELTRTAYPAAPAVALADAVVAATRPLIERGPNVDLALAALTRTLGLPAGASMALFALARTIGWIGHAIEQYDQDTLIRPRAAYVGPPIGS